MLLANNGTFEISNSTSAQASVPATYLSTVGTHVVHGRITDSLGDSTDYTTTITINPPPTATFSNAGAVDVGSNGDRVLHQRVRRHRRPHLQLRLRQQRPAHGDVWQWWRVAVVASSFASRTCETNERMRGYDPGWTH
jgi:hypothetical protein